MLDGFVRQSKRVLMDTINGIKDGTKFVNLF